MNKVNCPYHEDNTASLHLYEDHFFCYGCSANGKLEDLDKKIPNLNKSFRQGKPENIDKAIERIKALPTKAIRGLLLPYNDMGYYVVYPNNKYYIFRRWEADDSYKYLGPYGHRKPLFVVKTPLKQGILLLVEGQINALTLYKEAIRDVGHMLTDGVVSPGAATDFLKPMTEEYCLQYNKICLIVDKDAAGVAAAIRLRDKLVSKSKHVVLYPMEKDLNDILVEYGSDKVKEEVENALKLFDLPKR